MDRNQIIGIVLILAMLVGYQLLVPKPAPEKEPAQTTQTTRPSNTSGVTAPVGSASSAVASTSAGQPLDSAAAKAKYGEFSSVAVGQSRDIVVENKDMKVTFSTQGGRVKEVILKKYKTYDQKPLVLIDAETSQTALELPTSRGKVDLHKLYYQTTAQSGTVSGQSQSIVFRAEIAPGQSVEQVYAIPADGYVMDYDLKLNGLTNLVGNDNIRFLWMDQMQQYENDFKNNRMAATINYLTADENFDKLKESESSEEATIEEPVQWFTIKHKYFLAGFVAKNAPLQKASFKALVNPDVADVVKTAIADVSLPMADVKAGKGNYKFYYGPNDFQLLGDVAPEFDQNVYLGYSVLKPINKYFFVPVFNFLEKFISNYGLLIIALVVFVKLVLTPLTYKSYISMAKMRVLQPELNEMKERVGDDMAKQQSEQMKLYQEVGVSPLNGCIPVLATMPILFSLFMLFPNLIELRQKPFLWASDLSTYDAFITFPAIPFVGSHLSLFTVLMTASSIAFAYYNNQTTPTQPGPVNMKALSYVFPLMFMFVLNSYPAGLTFYYFVSNVVTIAQQQLIRRFVDEDKLKAVLDENRRKNASGQGKKPGGFQAMLQKQLAAADEARKLADEASRKAKQKK
ncbi:membrane protein insertase YidC [Spirosoma utsteinense]|uniref:Membrane protein insertase YidC n=1 Tax=Spirosoma utsteinense TaxID=2585773 RepID=A0ABR6W230_9BACT|nr:membrane protein insertase YidC [Spirosoma utsteinense]MBC3789092.1 YidC/Oxa1 family membrane protein insertase [Spirosoma utsteinense]MBC3789790.1 YidC/Oxa1 family membrane protein insertase [Spirosoma utsteinense]